MDVVNDKIFDVWTFELIIGVFIFPVYSTGKIP